MKNDGTICIKSDFMLVGMINSEFPPILIKMALDLHHLIRNRKATPFITSAFREGDSGVHGYYRGLDYRVWDLTVDQIESICIEINTKYQYNENRSYKECLIYHDTGRGPHLHLQSHPNTGLRKE